MKINFKTLHSTGTLAAIVFAGIVIVGFVAVWIFTSSQREIDTHQMTYIKR